MFSLLRASEFPISLQENKSLILTDGNFTLEHSGNYLQNSVLGCLGGYEKNSMKFWLPLNIIVCLENT